MKVCLYEISLYKYTWLSNESAGKLGSSLHLQIILSLQYNAITVENALVGKSPISDDFKESRFFFYVIPIKNNPVSRIFGFRMKYHGPDYCISNRVLLIHVVYLISRIKNSGLLESALCVFYCSSSI